MVAGAEALQNGMWQSTSGLETSWPPIGLVWGWIRGRLRLMHEGRFLGRIALAQLNFKKATSGNKVETYSSLTSMLTIGGGQMMDGPGVACA
jgi:hypothetical protein